MARVIADALFPALREAGIADLYTRRVVIDIQTGRPPVVHIERFGDTNLLQVIRALEGVEIKREEEG